jgi:hypothetical protein
MFGSQLLNITDEQLMAMLRHFVSTGSHRLDSLQAELWRRNLSQKQYVDWLKIQQGNESKPKG